MATDLESQIFMQCYNNDILYRIYLSQICPSNLLILSHMSLKLVDTTIKSPVKITMQIF